MRTTHRAPRRPPSSRAPRAATARPARLPGSPLKALFDAPALPRAEREEFFSALSHALRNPLVGSSGYLDYLFKGYAGKLTPDQLTQLGFARSSVLQLQKVIDTLLDLVAFDLNLMQLSFEPVDLNSFTAQLGQDMDDWVSAEGLSLSLKGISRPLRIKGDARWLRVLFYEVVSNAIRVSPPGGTVEFQLWKRGTTAVIQISDQGPGVPHDKLAWIFEPLTQIRHHNAAPKGERGGLGLALAHHVAKAHGGRLWADLGSKRGLAVRIELPLLDKSINNKVPSAQGGVR